jgi:hypothetical protein
LYTVANHLRGDISKLPLPRNTLIVPASLWTIEDFNAQCVLNPLRQDPGDGHYEGTYGAILLDGATINSPNQFALAVSAGWSHSKYSALLATCGSDPPIPNVRWARLVEGWDRRVGVPLLPFAAYLAYWAPAEALKGAATASSSSTSVTTGNVTTSTSTGSTGTNNGILAAASAAGLGNFLEGVSGFTIGDTSIGMTTPRAYDDLATTLSHWLGWSYCDGYLPNLATTGCLRRGAYQLMSQAAQEYSPQNAPVISNPQGDATSFPRFVSGGVERVCATPQGAGVAFRVTPPSATSGCDADAAQGVTFTRQMLGEDAGAASCLPESKGAFIAANLIHDSPVASACRPEFLRAARSLFCLIETGAGVTEDRDRRMYSCSRPFPEGGPASGPWPITTSAPTSTPVEADSKQSPADPKASHPRGTPVYVASCGVKTSADTHGTWNALATAQFESRTRYHIIAVEVAVTPRDRFGDNIDEDESPDVTFDDITWVRGASGSDPKSKYAKAPLQDIWLVPPPFVTCDPVAVAFSDHAPWHAPKVVPTPTQGASPSAATSRHSKEK